jgi:hypothetical protein
VTTSSEANAPGHAFISYVREDSDQVDRLQRTLEAAGIRVWRDTESLWPGEDWRARIRQAITHEAFAFIACFSSKSLARETSYQNEELTLAIEQLRLRRPDQPWLIPVRLDDCIVPDIDIGGGRTLASIQRADLFGEREAEGIARLVAAVLRILGRTEGSESLLPATTQSAVAQLKTLLPLPEKVIELDELVSSTARRVAELLDDVEVFPVARGAIEGDATREIVGRCIRYFDAVRPLVELLVAGCGLDPLGHDDVWTRSVETIARTAGGPRSGVSILVELRQYPVLPALFGAAIAGIARGNFSVVRAVAIDAQMRNSENRKIPLIGSAHPLWPFRSDEISVNVLAIETSDARELTSEEVQALRSGRIGKRYTPASDHLHDALRPLFVELIPDDDDYDEAFDVTEVVLGIAASDAKLRSAAAGYYVPGPWFGSFTWRRRFGDPPFEYGVWEKYRPLLLGASFFDSDQGRADDAFREFAEGAARARSNRW